MKPVIVGIALVLASACGATAQAPESCDRAGPQTPRDITKKAGTNSRTFALAPASTALNLCNIHFHTNAEHKGPGFSVFAGAGEQGGYRCNDTRKLTPAQLKATEGGACKDLKPGDTIEVHWVFSSCKVAPGEGLGSCLAADCTSPELRVETQVFLVVNDRSALDFANFDYSGAPASSLHQPRALPANTGTPVVFRGSTTGPDYNSKDKCSPVQATWSVRPACARIDIGSLNRWCERNAFKENYAHGVRQLVTAPALLDRIK